MNNSPESNVDILIIGAGMAGLLATADLQANGFRPLVVDKGRGVGGRLSTRRIGAAAFDHGAQFMTARTPRFTALLDSWRAQGVLAEWYRGAEDAHIRWRGVPGMTAPAKHLAQSLNVRLEMKLLALHPEQTGWRVVFENGESLTARAALLTAPVPQSLAVLDAGGVRLNAATRAQLEAIDYEPCIAVMAVLNAPSRLPSPGFLRLESEPIAWLADNQAKGVSSVPSITLHATPTFSRAHWNADRQDVGRFLLAEAAPWLGSEVSEFQVHGWRYARPASEQLHPCLTLRETPPLVLAGDAFGGPRVEGAALSGWAAAEALLRLK